MARIWLGVLTYFDARHVKKPGYDRVVDEQPWGSEGRRQVEPVGCVW
jgi:hypothetical protein